MSRLKRIAMATGTFAAVLGTGLVMQNGDALASRLGAQTAHDSIAAKVGVRQASAQATSVESAQRTNLECVPGMTATPSPAAMVELSVTAPCHAQTSFKIHHQGMIFTATTDTDGNASLSVPGLADLSVMIAAFDDGHAAVATAALPDFESYERAVLQWQGATDVILSAYEGDATYGGDGHIHAENSGDVSRIAAETGGYLVRLGDDDTDNDMIAEIYTYPTGTRGVALDVRIVAEVEITSSNCGKEIAAQSIQVSPSGGTSARDLVMVMPDCDAVGDFLVLQNMFQDLTLASK